MEKQILKNFLKNFQKFFKKIWVFFPHEDIENL